MKFLLFIMMFSILTYYSEEKTGRISGTVFDATNDNPLGGIKVSIISTTLQRLTDDSGSFEFNDLIPGIYEIEFKSMWYQLLKLENIEVKVSEPTVLKVSLIRNDIEVQSLMDSFVTGHRGGIRSNMIIVRPDSGIDYKMLVIEPDSTMDYKMIVIKPLFLNDANTCFDRK